MGEGNEMQSRLLSEENTSSEWALWMILLFISLNLLVLFVCVVCCVIRCFVPEESAGPAWAPNKDGRAQIVGPNKSLWAANVIPAPEKGKGIQYVPPGEF